MAKEITLPKLSEDADEGSVAEVMVKKGDTIEKDDSIIAVESDKATVDVPSPEGGTVKEVKVSEGDSIKTGDVILLLEDDGQDENKEEKPGEDEKAEEKEEPDDEAEQESGEEEEEQESSEKQKQTEDVDKEEESAETEEQEEEEEDKKSGGEEGEAKQEKSEDESVSEHEEKKDEKEASDSEQIPAAPGARQLARKHGIDLREIKGSGPDGLITKNDIEKVTGSGEEKETPASPLPDFSQWGTTERQPLSEIRKATAQKTQSSWQTIPHVTQFDEANVTGIEKYIENHQSEAEEQGGKLTVTAVLTKVIANALHQFPKFNASIDMNAKEVILKKYVHIGIAVDTDGGLLVPVVRNVDEKSIIKLAAEITDLAGKARNRELSKEDMEGGNFIISNLGGIGGTQFTPVIFHPQVAILGVSKMMRKPVYNDEKESFEAVLTLPLSLSYDHRLIDGAEGARFLKYVCNALEDPYKALLGE